MTALTVTEVRNALRCPRVFALGRRFSKRVVFPVGASALGSAFHRIADRFAANVTQLPKRFETLPTSAPADELADAIEGLLLRQLVHELDRNPTYRSMPSEVDDLAEALRAYGGYLAQRIARRPGSVADVLRRFLHGAEVTVQWELSTPAGTVQLSGRIDAIHAPDEHSYEVVEYKLTDESTEELDRAQVALYRRMLQRDREAVPIILRFGPGLVTTRLEPQAADDWVERELIPLLGEMAGWVAKPESAPATKRTDLCPSCPLRAECVALHRDAVPPRDDPPANAYRPRPSPTGDVELPTREAPGAPEGARAPADRDALAEASRLVERVVQLYADQGVEATVRQPPRVGSRLIRVEVTLNRGSIKELDRASVDVLHHLEADHGISADYAHFGARRVIDAQRSKPGSVRLSPLLGRCREWLSARPGRFVLGEDVEGEPLRADLSDPTSCHLLIGGTTGSGKSVLLRSIAAGLVQYQPPSLIQLMLVDPKRVTFGSVEAGLGPHLARPVCFDAAESVGILTDLVAEMEDRYQRFAAQRVEHIDDFNAAAAANDRLPRYVLLIDEFQDLLASKDTKDEFLASVQRLGAKARAAGIHLVLATQHPDRKTVPAAIKVNMTGKIALKVHQATDSLVVLGARGAEKLLGNGDLLADLGRSIVRAQGALP
ncbi:MAG: PD-(D/E)XK nuclease family protein [Myxococcales bacterium]|nr:PD-(D/E)XK nuclease family protein [Myxococcales bacterium]